MGYGETSRRGEPADLSRMQAMSHNMRESEGESESVGTGRIESCEVESMG